MKLVRSGINSKVIGNPLLRVTYLVVLPLARQLVKAKFSPTSVTHLSNIFFVASLFFFLNNNPIFFSAFLIFSFILDVADGIVARQTNSSSACGSLYDHSSDDLKILLLLFVVGFHYNTPLIWFLTFAASSLTLLVSSNSYSYSFKDNLNGSESSASKDIDNKVNFSISAKTYLKGLISSIFRLDGNFMYYFFFLNPNHKNVTLILLIAILIVVSSNLIYSYIRLYKQAKHIDKELLRWK